MSIHLGDHFTCPKLLRFTLPSMVMLVVTSVYYVTDGIFVSRFVGKTAFAGVNFAWPFLMILGSAGFMLGSGGGALIGRRLGEKRREEANRIFSLIIYFALGLGVLLTVLGYLLVRPVSLLQGAEGELLDQALAYSRVYLLGIPALLLQYVFQALFSTAEKPHLGLYVTLAAGVTNILLDALFVGLWGWGVRGAAWASVMGQSVGGLLPLLYFGRENRSLLRLGATRWMGRELGQAALNGSSELMNNVSMAVVGMLYNVQLLKYAGEDGVAAYGVLMYVSTIFIGIYGGYAMGVSPVVSYHFGAANRRELHSLLMRSLGIIGIFSGLMFGGSQAMAGLMSRLFSAGDPLLESMTLRAFRIFSFTYLFSGLAILSSAFFTALNDGPVSAFIAFLRTMVFQTGSVLLFPLILELDGIWISDVTAEMLALCVSITFLVCKRKKYGY